VPGSTTVTGVWLPRSSRKPCPDIQIPPQLIMSIIGVHIIMSSDAFITFIAWRLIDFLFFFSSLETAVSR